MPVTRLPHLILRHVTSNEAYQRPPLTIEPPPLPKRERNAHATKLLTELREAMRVADSHRHSAIAVSVGVKEGVHLLFEVEPGFEENINSLEHRKAGIEIVAIQKSDDAVRVTVYVPAGKLHIFERKLQNYADPSADTPSGNPANARLISIISEIRLAVLADLWTDDIALLPNAGVSARFEVWTRAAATVTTFVGRATSVGLAVSETFLVFPDRRVFLVTGSVEQLTASVEVIDEIAELRRAKDTPVFYSELRGPDARDWSDDLLARITVADEPAAVSLLDSGVTHTHPLLAPFVDPDAMFVARPEWRMEDIEGHGTMMAGHCGFGVPSIDRGRWSASNHVTLLVESTIQPFEQVGSAISLNEMHLHRLPWPADLLRQLGEIEIELRVTLSYFIEPNPARRGWARRHRYASHGLRFEVQMPEETLEGFRGRVNLLAREADEAQVLMTSADDPHWTLGLKLRTKGSLQSDQWRGPAGLLADREHIAVFPVGGWWKEKPHLKRGNDKVDYSLVVSISAPELEIDLYTPIAATIATAVPITT